MQLSFWLLPEPLPLPLSLQLPLASCVPPQDDDVLPPEKKEKREKNKERGKVQVKVTGFYCTKTQKRGEIKALKIVARNTMAQ